MTSSKNKGDELHRRIPFPAVGPDWTRVVKKHPDGTGYCDEYYSPQLKNRYYILKYARDHDLAISSAFKYNGDWLSTR